MNIDLHDPFAERVRDELHRAATVVAPTERLDTMVDERLQAEDRRRLRARAGATVTVAVLVLGVVAMVERDRDHAPTVPATGVGALAQVLSVFDDDESLIGIDDPTFAKFIDPHDSNGIDASTIHRRSDPHLGTVFVYASLTPGADGLSQVCVIYTDPDKANASGGCQDLADVEAYQVKRQAAPVDELFYGYAGLVPDDVRQVALDGNERVQVVDNIWIAGTQDFVDGYTVTTGEGDTHVIFRPPG
jgi:hypothetical protein